MFYTLVDPGLKFPASATVLVVREINRLLRLVLREPFKLLTEPRKDLCCFTVPLAETANNTSDRNNSKTLVA